MPKSHPQLPCLPGRLTMQNVRHGAMGTVVRPMSRPLDLRLHMLTRSFPGETCEMVSSEDADVQGQAWKL